MDQARVTDATVAEFLRAISAVPDRAPLDDLLAAVGRFADQPGALPVTLRGVLDLEIGRRSALAHLSAREAELEEHRRLHAVLHLQLAVVALDLEGRIASWNEGAERLLGWSATDVEGTQLRALLPADASGHDLEALRRTIEAGGSLESFEVRLRHQDGRYRELEGSISAMLDGAGRATGYSVIYRDVGERNAALRRLAENEELFRRLAESGQDVVYRAQFDQLLPHVEYVSPSARQRLGFDAAQWSRNRTCSAVGSTRTTGTWPSASTRGTPRPDPGCGSGSSTPMGAGCGSTTDVAR